MAVMLMVMMMVMTPAPLQPLDQLTCIHNCLEQLDTHTRSACLDTATPLPDPCLEKTKSDRFFFASIPHPESLSHASG